MSPAMYSWSDLQQINPMLHAHTRFAEVRLLPLPAEDLPQSLKDLIKQDDLSVTAHTLHIGYDQMSADEIIRVGTAHMQHC